jgi:aspartyl/asparaginyl-tRNA synthetase
MTRKIVIAVLMVLAIGGGAWYYFSRVQHTKIETILSNPGSYEGKEVTIEGAVTDRTAFFPMIKFFRLKDKTGEIIVVTKKALPEVRASVRVKGKIDEAFQVGDQKLVIIAAESVDQEGGNK